MVYLRGLWRAEMSLIYEERSGRLATGAFSLVEALVPGQETTLIVSAAPNVLGKCWEEVRCGQFGQGLEGGPVHL